jgi:preprotein translocase subunit YajC
MLTNVILMMGGGGQQDGGSMWSGILMLVVIFIIFYFFIIRPQSKRQKQRKDKVNSLKKGDKIITSGGMIANVTTVDDDTVLAEIDKGVKARFNKSAITDVNPGRDKK